MMGALMGAVTYATSNSITYHELSPAIAGAMTAATGNYYSVQVPIQQTQIYYQQGLWPQYGGLITNQVVGIGVVETEAQRKEREQREKEWQEKEDARRARAKNVLVSVLNEKQREQFEAEKHFELEVNDRLYRVKPGMRVERLEKGSKKVLSYFCIHASHEYNLPAEDVALSQKLLLETNETEFLRVANETKAA